MATEQSWEQVRCLFRFSEQTQAQIEGEFHRILNQLEEQDVEVARLRAEVKRLERELAHAAAQPAALPASARRALPATGGERIAFP